MPSILGSAWLMATLELLENRKGGACDWYAAKIPPLLDRKDYNTPGGHLNGSAEGGLRVYSYKAAEASKDVDGVNRWQGYLQGYVALK